MDHSHPYTNYLFHLKKRKSLSWPHSPLSYYLDPPFSTEQILRKAISVYFYVPLIPFYTLPVLLQVIKTALLKIFSSLHITKSNGQFPALSLLDPSNSWSLFLLEILCSSFRIPQTGGFPPLALAVLSVSFANCFACHWPPNAEISKSSC